MHRELHVLKEQDEYFRVFLACWIRYFGAPLTLVSDQEGAVISDMFGRVCEAFTIKRDLAGSDGHTRTGIAERRLGIVKLGALKLYAQAQKQGMRTTQDDCVYESAMSTNSVLVYDSSTPNQAVLGFEPRDLYTIDDDSLCAYKDARSTRPDAIECAMRQRLLAKDCIIQAVIEHRIAESANTKVQQYTPEQISTLTPGCQVDIFHEPESKEISGWKGPADLIHIAPRDNKAIVQWRGHPMGLPLRHVRPHIGFLWLLNSSATDGDEESAELVSLLMNLVDDHALGQVFTYGKIWSRERQAFYFVPDNIQEQPPKVYTLAVKVASSVLQFSPVEGIQFGTACKSTEPLVNVPHGKLVVWNKSNRPGYKITSVVPSQRYTLTSRGSYTDFSFLLLYNRGEASAEDKKLDIPEKDLDISDAWSPSTIPWTPADWDLDSPDSPLFPHPPGQDPMVPPAPAAEVL